MTSDRANCEQGQEVSRHSRLSGVGSGWGAAASGARTIRVGSHFKEIKVSKNHAVYMAPCSHPRKPTPTAKIIVRSRVRSSLCPQVHNKNQYKIMPAAPAGTLHPLSAKVVRDARSPQNHNLHKETCTEHSWRATF